MLNFAGVDIQPYGPNKEGGLPFDKTVRNPMRL